MPGFSDVPSTHIAGYVQFVSEADGTALAVFANATQYLAIPVNAAPLANLTTAEANATTGSWRKIAFELMDMLYDGYAAMATADQPTKATITRSGLVSTSIADQVQRTISGSFNLDVSTVDVAAE